MTMCSGPVDTGRREFPFDTCVHVSGRLYGAPV